MEVDDVFAQLVVLRLQLLQSLVGGLELLDLLLEFADIALLALTESSLFGSVAALDPD